MRFVVVADTHVRSETADPGDFAATAHLAARNQHAVDVINRLAPDFVVHLGDVVHPIPGSPAHGPANELAAAAYATLGAPLYMVPGNHDVGDKPYRWVDAPAVAPEHYATFTARYGPRYQTFRREDCSFVLVDTPVLNTGWDAENEQWDWLEATLDDAADSQQRVFMFGHYPLYLWDPDEHEHYDNLANPARSRLLTLLSEYKVEAVFAGHVHRFFHRRYRNTDLYIAPATGFVRPEYAELDSIAPNEQFGRDDRAKLGLFVVEVEPDGHRVHPVRTSGARPNTPVPHVNELAAPDWSVRIGVTMRQGWAAPKDLAMDGLDRFVRKRARDDSSVMALWEARIGQVRIPLADLQHGDSRERIAELGAMGTEFTVLVPGADALGEIPDVHGVTRHEVVLARDTSWDDADRCAATIVAVGPVAPVSGGSWSGDHFVAHGFDPASEPEFVAETAAGADEAVFRVSGDAPVWETVAAAARTAGAAGVGALITVGLTHLSEGSLFDDDAMIANRVVEAEIVARAHGDYDIVLDGFADRDRGYFPRHGLLDRRGNPRDALRSLARFAALTNNSAAWSLQSSKPGLRTFTAGADVVHLVGRSATRVVREGAVSLIDGSVAVQALIPGPWLTRALTPGAG